MKANKGWSFFLIFLIYGFATLVGIVVFTWFEHSLVDWVAILFADIAATFVVYLAGLGLNNASVYDPYWSVQPLVILPLYAYHQGSMNAFHWVLYGLIFFWGIRLTLNWAILFDHLQTQDWRYDQIKRQTKTFYPLVSFLGIHLMPTLIVFACQLPFLLAIPKAYTWNQVSLGAALVCFLATMIEWVADYQKQAYRKEKKGIVTIGLWKRGRHPNYFGEMMMWWGVFLYIVSVDVSLWWSGVGALINTVLFHTISVPLAEKQTKLRHPEEYDDYVARTRKWI